MPGGLCGLSLAREGNGDPFWKAPEAASWPQAVCGAGSRQGAALGCPGHPEHCSPETALQPLGCSALHSAAAHGRVGPGVSWVFRAHCGNLAALRPWQGFAGFFWSRQVTCKELGERLHFLP